MIFITILIFSGLFFIYYKNSYTNNQNQKIIDILIEQGAKKTENTLCQISNLLSWKGVFFDIYETQKSIVLIKSVNNLINQKWLEKTAETYLIIKEPADLPLNLFTNYIRVCKLPRKLTI